MRESKEYEILYRDTLELLRSEDELVFFHCDSTKGKR